MPGLEDIAGCPHVYRKLVDLTGLEERGLSLRGPIAATNDAVRQVLGVSFGMHIHQLGRKIRINCARGRIQGHRDWSGDLDILLQYEGGIHQNVFPLFHGTLIERPAGNGRRPAA